MSSLSRIISKLPRLCVIPKIVQYNEKPSASFLTDGLNGCKKCNKHRYFSNYPCFGRNRKDHTLASQGKLGNHVRFVSSGRTRTVLGIETSCDDTGAAIVDENGNILGEALHSQTKVHVEMGGIIPPLARDLHKQNIDDVVKTAMERAGMTIQDVDAVATTVKPGLIMSLDIGMKYTKQILSSVSKPFIPIHHMEAHALTARMIDSIPFPFLVLLVSGGHCLLAVALDVDKFLLLGKSLDIAPGDAIDKIARSLSLKTIPEYSGLSGGRSMELMAQSGNPKAFNIIPKMHRHHNCNFSFSGLRTKCETIIHEEATNYGMGSEDVLPSAADLCASVQYFILRHLSNRVQRAFIFCDQQNMFRDCKKTLVVSGGVASNQFLRDGLQIVCDHHNTKLVCPPPKLCTDNGIMIAWNGMEKLKLGRGFADVNTTEIQARSPLGRDISDDVAEARIKVNSLKLLQQEIL